MTPPVDPNDKIIIIVLILAGILMIGLIIFAFTAYYGAAVSGRSDPALEQTRVQPVMLQPQDVMTPGSTARVVPTPVSPVIRATTPGHTGTGVQNPTPFPVSVLPVTPVPAESSGPVTPRPFMLSVSPASASGRPGETISYTLRIDGGEGQTEPIHFTLTAGALFFSQTYDLGEEQPPFPKTSVYQFIVPGNIPSGITINGVLTATGAGQTREQPVTLMVV